MWKFVVLLFVSLVNSVVSSCYESNKQVKMYLDEIQHIATKAKLEMFSCMSTENVTCEKCSDRCGEKKYLDCYEWYKNGHNKNGVYTIWPQNRVLTNRSLDVYCDMNTDGGGWTVIQRRGKFGKDDWYFYKDWQSYKTGFGDIEKDFWLGNDNIFALTNQKIYSIRIDLQDEKKNRAYAKYKQFWIDDENNKYMLHIHNFTGGNAGDGMSYHNNLKFSTRDQDNDFSNTTNCALKYTAAWWYDSCYQVNLNGVYNSPTFGIEYRSWQIQPLYWTEIKIRPEIKIPEDRVQEDMIPEIERTLVKRTLIKRRGFQPPAIQRRRIKYYL